MPLLVRAEIERLFRDGALRYLVCTSTLLEGVNLPCRNLFVRGPKKGRGNPMTPADFWNLAGRAGRWGKEFQGNIVCVDAQRAEIWPQPPVRREREPLSRVTDVVLDEPSRLDSYIANGAPAEQARADPLLESMFSYLAARVAQGRSLDGLGMLSPEQASQLEATVRASLAIVEVDYSLVGRHAVIGPLAMQRLLDYFRHVDHRLVTLTLPESADAASSYAAALELCDRILGADFGGAKRQFALGILITDWMRGLPLAVMIMNRLRYLQGAGREYKLPNVIREVMADIEQYARFHAPKFLACYRDVLAVHLREIGQPEDADQLPDVAMMLELGVSRETEVSLMALGLSRTTAVALSEFITADALTPLQALAWLREAGTVTFQLPVIVQREIDALLASSSPPST
jgi:hypothetical protein